MSSWLKPLKSAIAINNGFVLITIIATKLAEGIPATPIDVIKAKESTKS